MFNIFLCQKINPVFHQTIDDTLKVAIKRLWSDKGIRRTFGRRATFQLPDSTKYFLHDRIDELARPDYKPTKTVCKG